MRKAIFTASALALTLGLSGCLVPEKFDASVNVKPDGSYTYKYDGSAVHYAAAAAIKEKGKLPEKDEVGLKREAEKAAAAPGVKKIAYRGDGRYDVSIDQELKAGEKVRLRGPKGIYDKSQTTFNAYWSGGVLVLEPGPTSFMNATTLRTWINSGVLNGTLHLVDDDRKHRA